MRWPRGPPVATGGPFPFMPIICNTEKILVKILLINNDGGGFADHIDVDDCTTVASLFGAKMPGRKASQFLIRVNRQPATADQILVEGDRISITPVKIEGAIA